MATSFFNSIALSQMSVFETFLVGEMIRSMGMGIKDRRHDPNKTKDLICNKGIKVKGNWRCPEKGIAQIAVVDTGESVS